MVITVINWHPISQILGQIFAVDMGYLSLTHIRGEPLNSELRSLTSRN